MNIAILSRRRRGGGGGPPAPPVTTTVVVSPSTFSITVGATQQLVAQAYDQSGNPKADTFTWGTSNAGLATVNSAGLVTGVAAGSPVITATSVSNPAKAGTSNGTVTSSAVTAVTLWYNGQNIADYGGMLLVEGTTYQLIAKDQTGSTLANGSGMWASSDATHAPVNSSGVASPTTGAATLGITYTFTHTASGHVGTAVATCLRAGTVLLGDVATNYTSDTNLLANVRSTVPVNPTWNSNVPTGNTSVLYYDGLSCNQIQIDTTRLFMGDRTFRMTIPVGQAEGILRALLPGGSGYARAFVYTVNQYEPGFTLIGGGSGAFAYKYAPWFTWPPRNGRCGPELTSGTPTGGGIVSGVNDSAGGSGGPVTGIGGMEFPTTVKYWLDILLYEVVGNNIVSTRHWHNLLGETLTGPLDAGGAVPHGLVEGPMVPGAAPWQTSSIVPFGENYNRIPTSTMWRNIHSWKVYDGVTQGDPLGLFGPQATPTLSTATVVATLAPGDTGKAITLTGTNLNENGWPIFSNPGIILQSRTISSGTTYVVTVNVDAGATSLPGTVSWYNAVSQQTTSSVAITVAGGGGTTAKINFRGTSGYVTDGPGETYSLGETYPTTRGGVTFGLITGTFAVADRNTAPVELAGVMNNTFSGTVMDFRLDVVPGSYVIKYALADQGFGAAFVSLQFLDNTTSRYTVGPSSSATTTQYLDVNGAVQTIAGFPGNWTATTTITIASGVLVVRMGNGSTSFGGAISALSVTPL